MIFRFLYSITLFSLCLTIPCVAEEATKKNVLIIGIDGVRGDALSRSNTPNLNRLIAKGAFTTHNRVIAENSSTNTISGPGWSSILTGVWADKHGVQNNEFDGSNFQRYPHFFAHLKSSAQVSLTASYVSWDPINQFIVSSACYMAFIFFQPEGTVCSIS